MNSGFEDWAYAGSWDPDRVIKCQPKTFGGYDAEKSVYNNSTLRVFNMLVETSNKKNPSERTLGNSLDVFNKDTAGNGHVSRNIRLSLLAVDVVQPYVTITGVNDVTLTDDVVPLMHEQDRSCQNSKGVMVPGDQRNVMVRWTVGGAFEIDSTELWFAKWESVPKDILNCVDQPTKEQVEQYFTKLNLEGPNTGTGFFSQAGSAPIVSVDGVTTMESLGPLFEAKLDVSNFKAHDKLVVIAVARADRSWSKQPDDCEPKIPPQSHIVNARTNPSWHHKTNDGKVIDGRLDWFSLPLTIYVGDYKVSVGTQAGRQVGTVEHSNRFGATTGEFVAGITPSVPGDSSPSSGFFSKTRLLAICAVLACAFLVHNQYSKSRRRKRRLEESTDDEAEYFDDEDGDQEEFGMAQGGYSDKDLELKTYTNR